MEAIDTIHRSVSREAHRNGVAPPDRDTTAVFQIGCEQRRVLADSTFNATGSDDPDIPLMARTGDGRMAVAQVKIWGQPPGSAGTTPAPIPAPPPPAVAVLAS
ncbi:hypothetical protein ACFTUC_29165 [Streptomyces sp. NPDC056944]|uniref:hypothetical protein n=1 Tax=Streptomyces sp. NPDC056944 TaxID=3345972 RepID=UPI00362A7936